jgi:molybdopterin/thiamine biosynthesis adenylyltransferase
LDNISDRLLLQDFCENLNKPLISAAVEGWIGQISLILPGDKTLSRFYNVDNKVSNVSCLSFTVSLLASLQASETIKYLLNKETNIRNKILFINLLNNDFFFEE